MELSPPSVMLSSKITQYLSLYCPVSPKLPFPNLKTIPAAHAAYSCIQTPRATATPQPLEKEKTWKWTDHLQLMLAGLLGTPSTTVKSSKMKETCKG